MRTKSRGGGLVVAAALAALVVAAGASAAGFEGDEGKIAAVISGEVTETGELFVGVEPGPVMTRALRIYSEPSHAPLVFVATLAFSESAEGEAWQAGWKEEPPVFAELGELASGGFSETLARPLGDTGIQVWVWGEWADGSEEERLVSEAEVGSGSFFFFSAPDEPLGSSTHACVSDDGTETAIVCAGTAFTCVPEPACVP